MEYINKQLTIFFENNIKEPERIWLEIKDQPDLKDKFIGILPATSPIPPGTQFDGIPMVNAATRLGDQVVITRKKVHLIIAKNGISSMSDLFFNLTSKVSEIEEKNPINRIGYIGAYYVKNGSPDTRISDYISDDIKEIIPGTTRNSTIAYATSIEIAELSANDNISIQPGMVQDRDTREETKAILVLRDINSSAEEHEANATKFKDKAKIKQFIVEAESRIEAENTKLEGILK